MKPSEELKAYIEAEIIPRYGAFDAAHRTDHVRTVIAQSLVLAGHYEVDADMVYASQPTTTRGWHTDGSRTISAREKSCSGTLLCGSGSQRNRWP